MMDYPYIAPCSHFLICAYEIPRSVDHAGLLKVGETNIKTAKKASEFAMNSIAFATPSFGKIYK